MGLIQREKRDIYYLVAKSMGYRSRSALKLLQMNEKLEILNGVQSAVDLCASPGGFSQVLTQHIQKSGSNMPVLGIDIQPIHPIEGAEFWVRDITDSTLHLDIIKFFGDMKVDLVVSDGAPDALGNASEDGYYQADLALVALQLATHILKKDGTFVVKVFRGKESNLLAYRISQFFESVIYAKPRTCRQSSCEAFLVCKRFTLDSTQRNPEEAKEHFYQLARSITSVPSSFHVDFVVCGVPKYDADANYPEMPEGFQTSKCSVPPIQLPTNPSYRIACLRKKDDCLEKPCHNF